MCDENVGSYEVWWAGIVMFLKTVGSYEVWWAGIVMFQKTVILQLCPFAGIAGSADWMKTELPC